MRRLIALLTAGFLMITLAGCQKKEAAAQIFAMDTVMNMAAYGGSAEKALAETEAEILRLEQLLSRTDADSEVSRLNTAGGASVDIHADVETLIRSAGEFSAATDGAFDITIAPVVSAWGFTEDAYRVPEQAELETLLETVGMEHVTLADGQAAHGMMELCRQQGAEVVGVGIAVEKGFQPGGKALRDAGVPLVSLAVIDRIEDGKIILRPEDD